MRGLVPQLLGPRPQRRAEGRHRDLSAAGLWRHSVLQVAELLGGLQPDDVRPRGQGLPDLEKHGERVKKTLFDTIWRHF